MPQMTPKVDWTNLDVLKDACDEWLQGITGSTPWYPGRGPHNPRQSRNQVTDLVLLGDFAEQLSWCADWPEGTYRLWVLGTASRLVSANVIGIPDRLIGVVPRYELFPASAPPCPKPRHSEPWTLVHVGRLSQRKNFDLVLRVVSALQTEFDCSVRLMVFGSKNEPLPKPYRCYIEELVERLPWRERPRFTDLCAPTQWPRKEESRPVFISLSSDVTDDFGLAVAQAQAQGWPAVLSDWGGHRDVKGESVLKLPVHLLGLATETESVQSGRAFAIAREIDEWIRQPRPKPGKLSRRVRSHVVQPPVVTTRRELRSLVKENGWQIPRDGLVSPKARLAYARYCEVFAAPRKPKSRTVVVQVDASPSWPSLQEIVPAIEKSWAASSESGTHAVETVMLREGSFLKAASRVAHADRIVIPAYTAFPLVIESFIRVLRRHLGIHAPLVIHLHGEGASACLSLGAIDGLLNGRDSFLAASRADLLAFRTCYPKARARVVPFALAAQDPAPARTERSRRFVYSGRISEQKNLHTLLVALWLLQREGRLGNAWLDVYGRADGLGSPNMGKESRDYLSYLKTLARRLGVSDRVRWRGWIDRSEMIDQALAAPCVFVSPTLHSDENFGAAALSFLNLGMPAVLTRWGGHIEFMKAFGSRCFPVSVRQTPAGPSIAANDLAEQMAQALRGVRKDSKKPRSNSFGLAATALALREFAAEPCSASNRRRLERSELMREILERRATWMMELAEPENKHDSWGRDRLTSPRRKVFSSYSDPLAVPFFRAYGAKPDSRAANAGKRLALLPWVQVRADGTIAADDPHRGQFVRMLSREERRSKVVTDLSGREHHISAQALRWLIQNGFVMRGPV